MQIEKVTRYVVDGREFPTVEEAQDYVDSLVDKILRNQLIKGVGFSANEAFKISQVILDNREILVTLLSCKFNEEDSDE